jgi:hypothetical protein
MHTEDQNDLIHSFIHSFIGGSTVLCWTLAALLSFFIHSRYYSMYARSARRKVATYTQTQNKRTQTSMPRVRFEPTIPVFECAETVHALDRAATVDGSKWAQRLINLEFLLYVKAQNGFRQTSLQERGFIPWEIQIETVVLRAKTRL